MTAHQLRLSWLAAILACGLALPLKMAAAAEYESQKDCLSLSEPGHYPDYEPLPIYSVERREHDISKPPVLVLQISVSPKELRRGSMARLGCKLASSFPGETKIYALIFDDKESARRFEPGFIWQIATEQWNGNHEKCLWHLRAHFEWDATTKQGMIGYVFPEFKDGLLAVTRVTVGLSAK